MPFRCCEIVPAPEELDPSGVRQVAVTYPFNDGASSFVSSDEVLNEVWELSKHSIKATSFMGVYVDGDRERLPYEADAYINQLGHYCVDREFTMARHTHEHLLFNPTWPTEWILHSVFTAWADLLYTGNTASLQKHYADVKAKALLTLARGDGLISAQGEPGSQVEEGRQGRIKPSPLLTGEALASIHRTGQIMDIVDWPPVEAYRDGYVFRLYNTVVNAFHYQALVMMSRIAQELDRDEEKEFFTARAAMVKNSFNEVFLDTKRGIYVDGEGTDHASLHANMFPLAFGLVPEEYQKSVVEQIRKRGIMCNVYGAQYLLEALYLVNEGAYALEILTSKSDKSWWYMKHGFGSTITTEVWGETDSPDRDLNHAWGAAPANIIPRYLMGVRPLEPGFGKMLIHPQPGPLEYAALKLPTIRGPVQVRFEQKPGSSFLLEVVIPANAVARIVLPKMRKEDTIVELDGKMREGMSEGDFVVIDPVGSGKHVLKTKRG